MFSGLVERSKKTAFRLFRKIPAVKKQIEDELESISKGFEEDVRESTKNLTFITELPKSGIKREDIINKLDDNLTLGKQKVKKKNSNGLVDISFLRS